MGKNFYELEIEAPEADYERIAALLSSEAAFGWEEKQLAGGAILFRIYCEDEKFLHKLRSRLSRLGADLQFSFGEFEQTDWLEKWKEFFMPVLCGSRFVVLPPWLAQSEEYAPRLKIIIEPKSAFGTGHHASTALCLRALSDLLDDDCLKEGDSFLDLGCGSGVLGIAAAKSGLSGLGLDIDELAVSNAEENRRLNKAKNMAVRPGSIDNAGAERFNLLMANILADPLIAMAPAISSAIKPGGCLILSGILDIQARAVEEAFQSCGLPRAVILEDGEWRALVWRNI